MVEAWISQANARQRSGRAGRVRSGNCFCLYTRNRLEKLMRPFQVIYYPLQCAPLNNQLLTKSHVELGDNSIVKVHVYLVMIKWQMNWITMCSFHSVCFTTHVFLLHIIAKNISYLMRFNHNVVYDRYTHGCLQLPEMLRVPLVELCLQIKLLRLGGIASFLERVCVMITVIIDHEDKIIFICPKHRELTNESYLLVLI